MKKTLLYCLIFLFFGLSFWQIIRFRDKHEDFLKFNQHNSLNKENSKIFAPKNLNQIYHWKEQKFDTTFRLSSNRLTKDLPQSILRNDISDDNLYGIHTVCGKYFKNKGFTIYNPKTVNGITQNGYSIMMPLEFDNKIVLIRHFWHEKKSFADSELERLNNHITVILASLFANQISSGDVSLMEIGKPGLCFTGILADTKRYLANPIVSVFVRNDTVNHDWTTLNKNDLNKHLDMEISPFLLDNTIDNLSSFSREYRHHIFYALMWFCLGVCVMALMKKTKNHARNSDNS